MTHARGTWLNAAAILPWLISGLPHFWPSRRATSLDGQRRVAGGLRRLWDSASHLLASGWSGRLDGGLQPPPIHRRSDRDRVAVITLSLVHRFGSNSTPALLVIIATSASISVNAPLLQHHRSLYASMDLVDHRRADVDQHRDHHHRR